MTVRSRGVRKARFADTSSSGHQTYDYHSPGVTFECEKYLNDPKALAKLSGEVKIIVPAKREVSNETHE